MQIFPNLLPQWVPLQWFFRMHLSIFKYVEINNYTITVRKIYFYGLDLHVNIPFRLTRPPWILVHLSRSNFTKFIKPAKAFIPCAVIALFLLKLKLVRFERPERFSVILLIHHKATGSVKWQSQFTWILEIKGRALTKCTPVRFQNRKPLKLHKHTHTMRSFKYNFYKPKIIPEYRGFKVKY